MDLNCLKDCVLLYVEDEQSVQNQTKMILDDFVKEVRVASDGEEGLKMALEDDIDIIVTDIMMPHKNGTDMLKELKEAGKDTPAIITTAFTETEYLMEAIKLKVDGFITKPINIKDLINAVYTVMLPKVQKEELKGCSYMVDALSILVGGKKIEILKYIINNLDKEHVFYGSYQDIMDNIGVSKPTVVNMFKQLIQAGVLEKIKNKVYRFQNTKFIKEEA
ncbi:MAG TPA: response regulator transcription factor [Sulfurospirillum arcachonense]|nr:response regulator transcription factor [Sulfurospirillum arcachonense]HIP43891.1 response regulator transcription factor [Sulfurospirillum arcachonense]